jgi:uncharacterized membrane protein YhaH (DUF805 family)
MYWLQLFLSLEGRITRLEFWTGIGLLICFQLMFQVPAVSLGEIDIEKGDIPIWFRNLALALDVVCAWPLCAVMVKRQADRDQGPRISLYILTLYLTFSMLEAFGLSMQNKQLTPLALAIVLPLLGLLGIALVELGMRRGTIGPNRFGPDPLQG